MLPCLCTGIINILLFQLAQRREPPKTQIYNKKTKKHSMIRKLVPTLYPVMLIMLLMWDWKFDAFRSNWFSLGFSPVTFSPINLTNTSQHEARKPVCIIFSIPGKDFEARTYRALFDFIIAYLWDYRNYLQSTDFDKQNTFLFFYFF